MDLKLKDKTLFLILILIGALYLVYIFTPNRTSSKVFHDHLNVHFIDVGQGDATLLKGPDFTVLIDAGRHDRNEIVPYLKEQNVKKIDLLIGTHPHADHIGQFPQILKNFSVGEVWLSGDLHTTITFENAVDAILDTNAKYREPRANEKFTYGSLMIEVLHPSELTGDLNNGSIVLRAIFRDIAFMFTGDAEYSAELEIIQSDQNLKSHILKIGHHGSITSSTNDFLSLVSPEVAVYSAGWKNRYEHPHSVTIERMNNFDILIYGTDISGTLILTTDGNTYDIESKKMQDEKFYLTD
jgi:beta-lactamase superfamily II metal-dependent hydrolase